MAATPKCDDNGGYDYELVAEAPDRLVCKICLLPSKDPYLTVCCGHLFCKICLDNMVRAHTDMSPESEAEVQASICPVCRAEEFMTFSNKAADREVRQLRVCCTGKGKGCEWVGEINYINSHLEKCEFEEVKCSNECGKMIQRQYLSGHVKSRCTRRKVNCQYCHDTGEHQFIEGQHKEECSKLPLPCPNKCEIGNVPREDIEAHRKECPLQMIQCEYYNVGCETKIARKDQENHNNEEMKQHLMMTNRKLVTTEDQLVNVKKQVDSLTILLHHYMHDSPHTHLPPHSPVPGRRIFPFTMGRTIKRNNSTDDQHAVSSPSRHAVISEAQQFVSLAAMEILSKSSDRVCPITLKILMPQSEFNKQQRSWDSDCFYTESNGYKMCIHIDSTGPGATHLSVFLRLMKSSHDDELTWPLRGKFEIKMLNQISDSEHHSATIVYDDDTPDDSACRITEGIETKGWGFPSFISNEDLQKTTPTCQYLKYDYLFFQVTKL